MSGIWRLSVGPSRLRAEAVRGGSVRWAGEAAYAGADDLAEVIARLLAEATSVRGCRRLAVELERPLTQARLLADLPPVKPRALPAMVAQQASRFFRRNGHPLVVDARWVKGTEGGGRMAQAVAVEEPLVEAIAAGARAAGLELESIAPSGLDRSGALSLLPPAAKAARRQADRLGLRRLALAAAGLWLGLGCLYGARLAIERRRIERELRVLAEPAAAVLEARRELHQAARMVSAIEAAQRERMTLLGAFEAVTRALPDSTFLTTLTLDADGSGSMTGAAPHAADVVVRLERAGAPHPKLEGQIRREKAAGKEWERFTLSFGPGAVR